MPRKDFLRDLRRAQSHGSFLGIDNIRLGEDDESIDFSFTSPSDTELALEFQAVISDLSEYPKSHEYLIFSTSSTVPPSVVELLDVVRVAVAGAPIHDLFNTLSDALSNNLHQMTRENPGFESEGNGYITDSDSGIDASLEDDTFDEDQQFFGSAPRSVKRSTSLRSDLRTAKEAGFKVGYLGDLSGSVIISISCRIAKLGISDEAMHAWGVESTQYLVLLIRFPNGYVNLKQILQQKTAAIQMHVGVCTSYKPSLTQAMHAFACTTGILTPTQDLIGEPDGCQKLLPLFIGVQLNSLLNERFIKLLELRYQYAFSWSEAELFFNNGQGLIRKPGEFGSDEYKSPDHWSASVPKVVQGDQLSSATSPDMLSFPLIAMQFTLRRFVKCTEFCLVCYCKTNVNFKALKPYVCSKPLCLYQYMSLGMGASLEWEIIKQPFVVDLLISFAYASAGAEALTDFPHGLNLMIPDVSKGPRTRKAILNLSIMQLTITSDGQDKAFMSPGNWIDIMPPENMSNDRWHCRVEDTRNWPIVDLSKPLVNGKPLGLIPNQTRAESILVDFVIYDRNFDEMKSNKDKCRAILMLLDTLPDVIAMKNFLESKPLGSTTLLASWDRMSSSALDLLKWIVASNRSCIMLDGDIIKNMSNKANANLVSGMDGYLQFRFAQGSPNKEEKFMLAVTTIASQTYPTIFAWHGSSLSNWHGIIREGLHYKKITHGRSYGDGVYMAQQFGTSQGFTSKGSGPYWSNSVLNITSAISLNEVVNSTKDFVYCRNGTYVVKNIEWIQTRYLFVGCQPRFDEINSTISQQAKSTNVSQKSISYSQDPNYRAVGPKGFIDIPITALNQQRRSLVAREPQPSPDTVKTGGKKRKPSQGGRKGKSKSRKPEKPEESENPDKPVQPLSEDHSDAASVATLQEDLAALLSDPDDESSKKKKVHASTPTTDFEPGTLTESSLTLLEPPSYATTLATKSLQQNLLQTLKVQEQNASDELGWYIDPQLINNPYQWIVELHSFDLTLPLGEDLKKAGLQSLILEMRFAQDFPMSPPFVRIVKPRLLEFNRGGGGHVTAGGALCMELLTTSGWLPSCSIESVLLSIRLALCSTDPKPARLLEGQSGGKNGKVFEYPVQDAMAAYIRACNTHGWKVPEGFKSMAW